MNEEGLLNTEEDVCHKVVVPFLRSVGFTDDELSFETSFSIRLGRFTYQTETGKPKEVATGRADVLIKRNGKNLAVVEIKGPRITLTPSNADQAISYARLVHPIAPLALVTNGKDWKGYDTLTKQELYPRDWAGRGGVTPTLGEDQIYEALQCFVGYSRENLLTFCRLQTDEYMAAVRGEDKSYRPEAYEPYLEADIPFGAFQADASRAFVLVGGSGRGKTCWLCNLAERLLSENQPVLFYRMIDVQGGVFDHLAKDLNWTLSPQYSAELAAKRFAEIFCGKIYIFIDAIDKLGTATTIAIIEELLRRAALLDVQLVATCRAEFWQPLLKGSDGPTLISDHSFGLEGAKGCLLPMLTEEHLSRIVSRYRAVTGFSGHLSPQVVRASRETPLLLRLACELGVRASLPEVGLESKQLLSDYLDRVLAEFGTDYDLARTVLIQLSREMLEQACISVPLAALNKRCGAAVDSLVIRLVAKGVLTRDNGVAEPSYLFQFDWIGDFVTAFWAMEWHLLTPDEIRKQAHAATGPRAYSLLASYLMLAGTARIRSIAGEDLWQRGTDLALRYQRLLDDDFPNLKRCLPPHTDGLIGCVAIVDSSLSKAQEFGFRPIASEDERLLLVPSEAEGRELLAARGLGATTYYFNTKLLNELTRSEDVEHWLRTIVERQISTAVESGTLPEDGCPELLAEFVHSVIREQFDKALSVTLGKNWKASPSLSVAQVEAAVLYRRAERVHQETKIRELIATGKIKVTVTGGIHSYVILRGFQEEHGITASALDSVKSGELMEESPRVEPKHSQEVRMLRLTKLLSEERVSELRPIVPVKAHWRLGIMNRSCQLDPRYDADTLEAIRRLYVAFVDEYPRLVRRSFPAMVKSFPLACSPLLVEVVVNGRGDIISLFCKLPNDKDSYVKTVFVEHFTERCSATNTVIHEGEEYGTFLTTSHSLPELLHPCYKYGASGMGSEIMPLRKLIYEQIEHDLPKATEVWLQQTQNSTDRRLGQQPFGKSVTHMRKGIEVGKT